MSSLPFSPQRQGEEGLSLSDEVILTSLALEGGIAWSLCHSKTSGETFIIARAASDEAAFQVTQLLKNEFALRHQLADSWAITPTGHTFYHGRYALIYPPFSFKTLTSLMRSPLPAITEFLSNAIKLCAPLSEMHLQGLIHGDIKPSNYFYDHDGAFRLSGFGLSSASAEALLHSRLPVSGGTLAYMSPEHTTRTPYRVNSLSDLYSLGIVLYELLTGKLPFMPAEGGYSEWVHLHIASDPCPPHFIRPDVPSVLSAIIMRLLAKLPENRYQSVAGLLADLRRCHGTLTEGGEIAEFTTGLRDTLSATDPSATLYASHPQAARLTAVLEKVSQSGTSCLVMITGAPGTGKSSLIFSALKHIQAEKVLLTVSKADRYSPVIPYALVTAALRSLTLHILGMPAAELTRWKSRILQAVGDCAGLAVNLVPELGLLLNLKSQTPTETDFVNAGAQFTLTACNLIKAFATAELPLVILIDDIHWADEASLHLFENLFKHHEAIPLMLIVTQRDLASLPCSLIHAHLTRLRHAANNVVEIMPEPLTVKAVARWLASVLHVRASTTTGLAQLIHEKTGGNPLFVQEFYQQAALDGLITSAKHTGKWSYDRKAIMARRYTENVASRVMQQLSVMPEQTKDLLGSLACLGGSGNLTLLSQVKYLTREEINDRLAPAVQAQLISLTGDNYAFTHDRVHETAFALIAAEAQNHLHYRAASQLAEQISHSEGNDALFRAVYHIALITGTPPASARAEEFYSLVFLAAKRAKNTGDYASALRFLQTARTLKPQRPFILMLEEAECEFLHGNLASALNICGKMLSAPGDLTEKARAACLMAEIHMRQSDIPLALETTIAWLAVFGIHFSRHPDNDECDAARTSLQQRVGRDPHSAFMPLALMQDREIESVMNLLASSTVFAIFVCPRLHFLLLCKMLHLTLDHGVTGASAFAISWYGVLIGDRYGEYKLGFRCGILARELVNQHDFTQYRARTLISLDRLSIWTQPISFAIDCAKATFAAAVAIGDRTTACFALRHQIMNCLARGDHLDAILTSIERALAFVRKARFKDVENVLIMQRCYVNTLRNPTGDPLTGDHLFSAFSPDTTPTATPSGAIALVKFWSWIYRGKAHFLSEEFISASHCFDQAARLRESIAGHIHIFDFHFYSALSLTVPLIAEQYTPDVQNKVVHHYQQIAGWANENPGTFSDKEALLSAEICRLEGKSLPAMEKYETAIRLSQEGGFIHINALCHELAGNFAHYAGLNVAADAYFKKAINAWREWGAAAKVRQLERKHPYLVTAAPVTPFNTISFAQNETVRDLESVVTAIRALTEEINLDRLINTLMMMLLERAGAQRCLLIRILDNNLPETEAKAVMTPDGIRVDIVNEAPTATDLPLSVLSAVIRTGQEIRTGKPEIFSPFSQDPYLVASGAAVMCVPVFKQAKLVGVLYFENRLMPDVFTAEHSKIISTLGAQAAVSLETARLYSELLEENVQRRRVEKELRASQTSLMQGEQISNTGSWRWELKQDLMMISDEYGRILGLPAAQKTLSMADFLTRVHPDDQPSISERVSESVRNGMNMRAEFRILRPDGDCRYILGIGDPVENWPDVKEYFGIIRDITAQRQAEDAVRIAQADLARVSRATTIGQLTASIAHEINQPLMSIVANAGASMRWLNRDPRYLANARESLQEIITEGKRAGDIIRGLHALTRKQETLFTQANLHTIARHILSISRNEIEQKWIALELKLQANSAEIYCDNIQIQQVLLNLIVNAIEAMSGVEHRPRILTLTSTNPSADTLRFEVADTGSGLSPDVIGHLFDSFFTTKKEGMGMGLTISQSIIKKHGGELMADNRLPHGSVFWFTLEVKPEQNT